MELFLSGASPPRVRAYLYGALLYYLRIAQKHKPLHISLTGELLTRDLRSFVIRFDFESYVRFEI